MWDKQKTVLVTKRCLVPIELGDYKAEIYCDVLLMNFTHVLLGHPWLDDMIIVHYGQMNTNVFNYYKGKKHTLIPAKPFSKDTRAKTKQAPQVPNKKHIHLITHKAFEKDY